MPNMANSRDQNTMKSAFLAGPSVRAAMTRIPYPDKPDRMEASPITAAPLGVIVRCTALGLLTCSERPARWELYSGFAGPFARAKLVITGETLPAGDSSGAQVLGPRLRCPAHEIPRIQESAGRARVEPGCQSHRHEGFGASKHPASLTWTGRGRVHGRGV